MEVSFKEILTNRLTDDATDGQATNTTKTKISGSGGIHLRSKLRAMNLVYQHGKYFLQNFEFYLYPQNKETRNSFTRIVDYPDSCQLGLCADLFFTLLFH